MVDTVLAPANGQAFARCFYLMYNLLKRKRRNNTLESYKVKEPTDKNDFSTNIPTSPFFTFSKRSFSSEHASTISFSNGHHDIATMELVSLNWCNGLSTFRTSQTCLSPDTVDCWMKRKVMWWAYKKLLIKFVCGWIISRQAAVATFRGLLFAIWFLTLFFQQREPSF